MQVVVTRQKIGYNLARINLPQSPVLQTCYSQNICLVPTTLFLCLIDHTQQWKLHEIWNAFHSQNYLISKRFSNFEHTTSKNCPLQMLISFANQNLVVLCVKRPRNGCSTNYLSFRFFKPLLATFALFLPLFPPNPTISTFAFNKMYKWSLPI